MNRRSGRAYIFVRWSASAVSPSRLGEIGWAFEFVDRQGRFVCFHCGATESTGPSGGTRRTWSEKCLSLPELIKTMSGDSPDRPGYDEVKVFEVENADPDSALQVSQRILEDPRGIGDPLEQTREILTRYGARSLASQKGFSAPFLWYNILPSRSVPIRKLAVHLFQIRAAAEVPVSASPVDVEDHARRMAQTVPEVLNLGECFVARVRTGFIVGLNVGVNPRLSVTDGYSVAQRVEEAVRSGNPKIRHIFVQVFPHEFTY